MKNKYLFDGGYKRGGDDYLFEILNELMPNEREEIITFVKNQDPYSFELFKEDCLNGEYSNIKNISPKPHTPKELKEIKEDLMYFLFDILPF